MADQLSHLTGLRAFEAAARHLSFQKAAEELGLTPSAVSHQIRKLEAYLDLRLFDRLPRAVTLTEEGARLFAGLEPGFRAIEDALRQVRAPAGKTSITLSAGPSIAAKWLVPRLYDFEEQNPKIQVTLTTSNRTVDLTRENIDIAIRHGAGHYDGYDSIRLFGEAYAPMCAPSLLNGNGPPLAHPRDLAHHRLLSDDASGYPGAAPGWRDWLGTHGVDPALAETARHYPQTDHAIQAAMDGVGVLFGRLTIAAPDLAAGRLVRPFPGSLPSDFGYFFVTRPGRVRERAISLFKSWLLDEAQALEDLPR